MCPDPTVVAINSNDATTHPADRLEMMIGESKASGYGFPYLFDESQEAIKAFHAP
jgi:hypothetical protein